MDDQIIPSLTEKECERIGDELRAFGYEMPPETDNDDIARLAACILDALNIEYAS